MKFRTLSFLALAFGVMFASVADAAQVFSNVTSANTVNAVQYLGYTRADLAAVFPNMSTTELDKLVFKVADTASMINTATSANTVNPNTYRDLTQDELYRRFPNMSVTELNKLWFEISDLNSR